MTNHYENIEIIDVSNTNIKNIIESMTLKKVSSNNNVSKHKLYNSKDQLVLFSTGWIDINDINIKSIEHNCFSSYKLHLFNNNLCDTINDLLLLITNKIKNKTYVYNFGVRHTLDYERYLNFSLRYKKINIQYCGSEFMSKNISPPNLKVVLNNNKVKFIFVPIIIQSACGLISIHDKIVNISINYTTGVDKFENLRQYNLLTNIKAPTFSTIIDSNLRIIDTIKKLNFNLKV